MAVRPPEANIEPKWLRIVLFVVAVACDLVPAIALALALALALDVDVAAAAVAAALDVAVALDSVVALALCYVPFCVLRLVHASHNGCNPTAAVQKTPTNNSPQHLGLAYKPLLRIPLARDAPILHQAFEDHDVHLKVLGARCALSRDVGAFFIRLQQVAVGAAAVGGLVGFNPDWHHDDVVLRRLLLLGLGCLPAFGFLYAFGASSRLWASR